MPAPELLGFLCNFKYKKVEVYAAGLTGQQSRNYKIACKRGIRFLNKF